MNKKEALKILGFSEDANPQQWELEERFEEKQNSLINNLNETQGEKFAEELLKIMDAHS